MTANGRQFIKGSIYQVKHPDSFVLIGVGMQVHPGIPFVNTSIKKRIWYTGIFFENQSNYNLIKNIHH